MCRTARDEDGTAENKYRTLEAEYGTAEKSRRMEKKDSGTGLLQRISDLSGCTRTFSATAKRESAFPFRTQFLSDLQFSHAGFSVPFGLFFLWKMEEKGDAVPFPFFLFPFIPLYEMLDAYCRLAVLSFQASFSRFFARVLNALVYSGFAFSGTQHTSSGTLCERKKGRVRSGDYLISFYFDFALLSAFFSGDWKKMEGLIIH